MAESTQGTAIPPVLAITDSLGDQWGLLGRVVYRNGRATQSYNVVLLLYYNHTVYHKNSSNNWWKWNNSITVGNPWVSTTDPRPKPTPVPTPPPHLPVGETRADFYLDDKLVNSTKLVPK